MNFHNNKQPNVLSIYSQHHHALVLDPISQEEFDKIITNHQMNNHLYMLAATRSGKSEFIKLIYIRLALQADASIVIFDPHGDLAIDCAKMMDDKKDIIYIDPTLKKGITPTINPFRLKKKDEETIEIIAQEIVHALESIIGQDFTPNMEVLITPLIYTLLRKGDSGIDELLKFLDDENNDNLIEYALKSPIKVHVDFMKKQFRKAKFTITKEALSTKLQLLLNNPTFSNFITGDSTFNLKKALNNKKIIIFRLPKSKMRKTLEPAAKLVMALIQGIIYKRSSLAKNLRPKTYLICDEYQNFFSQMSDEMLSESGKNNLFILGAHQYLSQLTEKSKDGLMSGANTKIVGRNSNKDLKVMAEEIEVDIQSLKDLEQGEFYIKAGSNSAIKIKTTNNYIGDKHAISSKIWKKHLRYQEKHYYKKILNTINVVSSSKENKSLPIVEFDSKV
jgi:hypothetical protein